MREHVGRRKVYISLDIDGLEPARAYGVAVRPVLSGDAPAKFEAGVSPEARLSTAARPVLVHRAGSAFSKVPRVSSSAKCSSKAIFPCIWKFYRREKGIPGERLVPIG